MERYILSFPQKDAIPDWSALLEPFEDRVTLLYEFPSGKSYVEMSPETLEELKKKYSDLYSEQIARIK